MYYRGVGYVLTGKVMYYRGSGASTCKILQKQRLCVTGGPVLYILSVLYNRGDRLFSLGFTKYFSIKGKGKKDNILD